MVQRTALNLLLSVPNEASRKIVAVNFRTRPPVDSDVKRKVKRLNYNKGKNNISYNVGHRVGWDLISMRYENEVKGFTVREVAGWLRGEGYGNCQDTRASVETFFGMWIDRHYKANYKNNEYVQKRVSNQSSGGQVSHVKSEYVTSLGNKGKKGFDSKVHKSRKRRLHEVMYSKDDNLSKKELKASKETYRETWDFAFPQSPLRDKEFDHFG